MIDSIGPQRFQGTTAEFEALVNGSKVLLYAVAFSYLRSRAEADDVVQDTFVHAYFRYGALSEPGRLSSWLCGIARYKAMQRNSRQPVGHASWDEAEGESGGDSPEDRAVAACERESLVSAVDQLPEKLREVVLLYYLADRSVADIAAIMGVRPGTIKWRLHEARRLLRKELLDTMADERKAIGATDVAAKVREYIGMADLENRANRRRKASDMCDRAFALIGGEAVPELLLARLYDAKGDALEYSADGRGEALEYYLKALGVLEALGDKRELARHHSKLGTEFCNRRDPKRAMAHMERAAALARECDDDALSAQVLFGLGVEQHRAGCGDYGVHSFEEALRFAARASSEGPWIRVLAQAAIRSIDALREAGRLGAGHYLDIGCPTIAIEPGVLRASGSPGFGTRQSLPCTSDAFWAMMRAGLVLSEDFRPGYTVCAVDPNSWGPAVTRLRVVATDERAHVQDRTFVGCMHLTMEFHDLEHETDEPQWQEWWTCDEPLDIWLAPGVGMVRCTWKRNGGEGVTYELSDYSVAPQAVDAATSLCSRYLPLTVGNSWRYVAFDDDMRPFSDSQTYHNWNQVDSIEGGKAYIAHCGWGYPRA